MSRCEDRYVFITGCGALPDTAPASPGMCCRGCMNQTRWASAEETLLFPSRYPQQRWCFDVEVDCVYCIE